MHTSPRRNPHAVLPFTLPTTQCTVPCSAMPYVAHMHVPCMGFSLCCDMQVMLSPRRYATCEHGAPPSEPGGGQVSAQA